MTKPPLPLSLLMALYVVLAIGAIWRTVSLGGIDIFTFGVVPVLIGLLIRAPWAAIVLKIYIALQTLGFGALAVTAIIAYQITPEDVKVVIQGTSIPMPLVAISIVVLLGLQYWVAFKKSTQCYLLKTAPDDM